MNCCDQTLNGIKSINTNSLTLDSTALIDNIEFLALDGIDTTQTIQQQINAITINGGVNFYGSFFDTTNQANTDLTNGNYFKCNNTDTAATSGLYVSNLNKFYIPTNGSGVYQIQFSAQILKSTGGSALVYIWLVKNGSQVADSAGQIQVQGNNTEYIEGWNYQIALNAGDYFQIKWHCDSSAVTLETIPASFPSPESPSVILTAFKLVSSGQAGQAGQPGTPGLIWRGTYNSALSYAVGDGVYLSGSSYICTVAQPASTGSNPESLIGWNYIALKGANGSNGSNGTNGTTPNLTVGTTTTLSPGSSATVTRTGTLTNPVFNFGIPQGVQGIPWVNYLGYWDINTVYNPPYDAISYLGAVFVCIQQAQGDGNVPPYVVNPPTPSNAYWNCIVDHGNEGIQGNQGEKGNTGDKGNTGPKGDKGDTGAPGGLDPASAATLAAVVLASGVSTAKCINIAIPPLTIIGLTTITGAVDILGSLVTPSVEAATILTTNINSIGELVIISGIQVPGQSNLNNALISDCTVRNFVLIPAGEEYNILTINDVSRDTQWYDGHDGHVIVKISSRHPTAGVETDNYITFSCQTNLNYTSLVSQAMTFKATADAHNFAFIDPTIRRIEYFGPAGLTDFLYDGTLRQTTWYDIDNIERFFIKTKATGGPNTDNIFSCKMYSIILGDSDETNSINLITSTLINIGNLCANIIIGNQSPSALFGTIVLGYKSTNLEIGNQSDILDIGAESNEITLGTDCGILSMGSDAVIINLGKYTIASNLPSTINIGSNENNLAPSNVINIGNGTYGTDITLGCSSDILQETIINGNIFIGQNEYFLTTPNLISIGNGSYPSNIKLGCPTVLTGQTTAINGNISIGDNEISSLIPNEITIGAGTYATDITIGCPTILSGQTTTINGTVNFTGAVNFTSGGGNFNLGDFMDQMMGII